MERHRCWLLLVVILAVGCEVGVSEIHRAKSLNAKPRPHHYNQYQYPPSRNALLNNEEVNTSAVSWMHNVVWGHETQTWLFSIISASLVGLSGIFPLIIIPIDAGKSLRSGAASDGLKLLLSFAVGGLLGDVFLHLLPEAWAHLQRLGGDHKGHMQVGLWILAGLLSFFVIQKIFPESDEGDKDEIEDQVKTEETEPVSEVHMTKQKNTHDNGVTDCPKVNGIANRKLKQNGVIKNKNEKNGLINGIHKNGFNKNGVGTNGVVKNRFDKNGITKSRNGFSQPIHLNGLNKSFGAKNGMHQTDENHNPRLGSSKQNSCWFQPVKNWVTGSQEGDDQEQTQSDYTHIKSSGWLNLMANMIDNFTHGLAVAGSYSISTKTGLLTTFAILLHEIPHEIGDFAILLRAGFDRWRAAKAQLLTATGGMLGALIALAAESTKAAGDTTAWVLPFTAGGFIYIALVTVVPDLMKEDSPWNSLKQVICLTAGIATMAMVTVLVD